MQTDYITSHSENLLPLTAMPIYNQALEVFKTCRAVARHCTDNNDVLEMKNSPDLSNTFSIKIVMHSLKLVEIIAETFSTSDILLKSKGIRNIEQIIASLHNYNNRFKQHFLLPSELLKLLNSEISLLSTLLKKTDLQKN